MWKFWLLILTLIVSGCQSEQLREAVQDSQVTEAQTPSKSWRVKPGSVYDGDTFRAIATVTGEEIRVRLSCVDAPEIKQAGGIESRDFLRRMLPDDQEVILAITEEDRFGRSVAEVFVPVPNSREEVPVNALMVRDGHAHFYERYKSSCPDNAELYGDLEQEAIANKVGVWSSGNAERPWDWRKRNK
jgi:endonuclease YncB( thermonuclease family)